MSADTLTADGGPVALAPASPQTGYTYLQEGYAVSQDQQHIYVLVNDTSGSSSSPYQAIELDSFNTAGRNLSGSVEANTYAGDGVARFANPVIATLGNGYVVAAWQTLGQDGGSQVHYRDVGFSGDYPLAFAGGGGAVAQASGADYQGPPTLFATIAGFALDMSYKSSSSAPVYGSELQTVDNNGHAVALTTTSSATPVSNDFGAHAFASGGGAYLQVIDNTLQYYANGVLNGPVAVPGAQPDTIESEAAALLADGEAVVTWTAAQHQYLSLFDPASNSFAAPILVGGPGGQLHAVALPDGGFVLSWLTGSNTHAGEVFDSAGHGGGVISLTGDAAGVTAAGEFFTVGRGAGGQYQVQHYTISAGATGGSGGDAGSGQTYTSDNNGDQWAGTSGNDTFHLGRGGDVVTGNGGNDTYLFAEVPWAGGHITDFNAGDVLDLTALAHTTADTGTDGFADGYLKITDSAGGAQVWAQYATSGSNSGWWLVETLDGVSASSLAHSRDVITIASPASGGSAPPPSAVSTSDSNYIVPASVNSVTLTGSNQTVTAYDHQDLTVWSDNGANTINGGSGNDVIHIGRGGDTVSGGGGRDMFVFDETPWAPATIQDFHAGAGDMVDVRGLLAKAGYTGTDPVADGYLKIQNGEIDANYHQPGNDGWWVVAKGVGAPGGLVYDHGFIRGANYIGGTYTTSGGYQDDSDFGHGYSTLIATGANGGLKANDGGDTLIDQGSNNSLADGRGNDTLILSPTTKEVDTGWGGLDTIVLNAHPQVVTYDVYSLNGGDRIDLHQLMQGMGYTGSDPIADGYIRAYREPQGFGQMAPNALQVQFDPDGPGGPAGWTTALQADGFSLTPHYSDGYFVF